MKNTKNQISLKLFNTVVSKENSTPQFISSHGVFVDSSASWAISDIKSHLKSLKLNGTELNKTFHKSWQKVQTSTRLDLAIEQIFHYLSTYGSNFESEMYLPNEVLNIPDLKLRISIITGISKDDMITKCLDILCSGIALKEDTLKEVFCLLEELKYNFTGNEGIQNKEANIILAQKFQIFPSSPEEFLRYIVFTCTESTSLVKSKEVIQQIEESKKDVSKDLISYGANKLGSIFNRFKPLFLALKKSNNKNKSIINKISKRSKTMHKPMPQNALNLVTQRKLEDKDTHWLDNATIYALFKSLSACHTRKEGQSTFVYRIRNGKSWVAKKAVSVSTCEHNYSFIINYLKSRIKGENKTVFIPEDIIYALPTSEKLFVGNIPTGTKFLGKELAAGIYWENSWGARDLDLTGLNISGKIGWNASYNQQDQDLTFSGDITNAENGAVEFLRAGSNNNISPTLVMNNVYSGEKDAGYKIVIGKGSDVDRDFMMNPNKVMAEIRTESVQKNTVLGLFMQECDEIRSFTLLNFGAGNAHVSGESEVSVMATKALYEQWKNPLSLNDVLIECGYNVISTKNDETVLDFNLEFDTITKSTFIDLFQ